MAIIFLSSELCQEVGVMVTKWDVFSILFPKLPNLNLVGVWSLARQEVLGSLKAEWFPFHVSEHEEVYMRKRIPQPGKKSMGSVGICRNLALRNSLTQHQAQQLCCAQNCPFVLWFPGFPEPY